MVFFFFNISLVPPVCLHWLVPNRLRQVFLRAQTQRRAGAVRARRRDDRNGPPVLHPCFARCPAGLGHVPFALGPSGVVPGVE